jgi:hypothetical protein
MVVPCALELFGHPRAQVCVCKPKDGKLRRPCRPMGAERHLPR